MQQKRLIAKIVSIQELIQGEYVTTEGWNPNFIKTPQGKRIHRLNLMAAIISTPEQAGNVLSFLVDDGTGNITVRIFEQFEKYEYLTLGSVINIMGRPREFSGELYIVPEIIKAVKDPLWITVRQKSLGKNKPQPIEEEKVHTTEPKKDTFGIISQLIEKLDTGTGADCEEVIKQAEVETAEKVISLLIQEGEIFEFTPGKLKLLR